MSKNQFTPTKEFPRQNQAPHEWPPQQGQAKGRDKSKEKVSRREEQLFNQYAIKGSNQSVTSSTTLADDDDLAVGLGGAGVYELDMIVFATAASTTPDMKWTFTMPSASSQLIAAITANTASATTQESWASDTIGDVRTAQPLTTDTYAIRIHGYIVNGSSDGNLHFQWAQNTSSADYTRVLAGSYISLRRVWDS
jgi:hypothetical protein